MPSTYGYKPLNRGMAPAAFTFFEVLAALVIVSISLPGLLKLHLGSIAMVDKAQASSQAVFLAREKLAEAAAFGYPEIGVSAGVADNDNLEMRWRTEVSECELPELVEAGVGGLREISVDIAWRHGIGLKHLQMSTCVAQRKL
jgi:type II secretory pathway pseudopilin PulG